MQLLCLFNIYLFHHTHYKRAKIIRVEKKVYYRQSGEEALGERLPRYRDVTYTCKV